MSGPGLDPFQLHGASFNEINKPSAAKSPPSLEENIQNYVNVPEFAEPSFKENLLQTIIKQVTTFKGSLEECQKLISKIPDPKIQKLLSQANIASCTSRRDKMPQATASPSATAAPGSSGLAGKGTVAVSSLESQLCKSHGKPLSTGDTLKELKEKGEGAWIFRVSGSRTPPLTVSVLKGGELEEHSVQIKKEGILLIDGKPFECENSPAAYFGVLQKQFVADKFVNVKMSDQPVMPSPSSSASASSKPMMQSTLPSPTQLPKPTMQAASPSSGPMASATPAAASAAPAPAPKKASLTTAEMQLVNKSVGGMPKEDAEKYLRNTGKGDGAWLLRVSFATKEPVLTVSVMERGTRKDIPIKVDGNKVRIGNEEFQGNADNLFASLEDHFGADKQVTGQDIDDQKLLNQEADESGILFNRFRDDIDPRKVPENWGPMSNEDAEKILSANTKKSKTPWLLRLSEDGTTNVISRMDSKGKIIHHTPLAYQYDFRKIQGRYHEQNMVPPSNLSQEGPGTIKDDGKEQTQLPKPAPTSSSMQAASASSGPMASAPMESAPSSPKKIPFTPAENQLSAKSLGEMPRDVAQQHLENSGKGEGAWLFRISLSNPKADTLVVSIMKDGKRNDIPIKAEGNIVTIGDKKIQANTDDLFAVLKDTFVAENQVTAQDIDDQALLDYEKMDKKRSLGAPVVPGAVDASKVKENWGPLGMMQAQYILSANAERLKTPWLLRTSSDGKTNFISRMDWKGNMIHHELGEYDFRTVLKKYGEDYMVPRFPQEEELRTSQDDKKASEL